MKISIKLEISVGVEQDLKYVFSNPNTWMKISIKVLIGFGVEQSNKVF